MEKNETKKSIRTFAFASFLNDMGSDMIYPIWPLFVTAVLGANMTVLGFIDGLGDALVSISQAVSGYFSDRMRKRKVFVWLGYLFGVLSRIGYAFTTAWQYLIPFKILDRAGKMRGAPRDAIIADLSVKEDRGRNFGLLRAMDNFGAACGIMICILFIEKIGYRNLFLLAALPSIAAALIVFLIIKEKKASDIKIYKGFSFKNLDNNFRLFLFLSALFALGSFSYSFLLVFAKKRGFRTAFIPVLYFLFTLFAAIFSLPFGRLADRIGRKAMTLISYLIWISVCMIFILYQNHLAIILGFVLYGLHKAALEPAQRTFVSELSPKEYRASGLGAFQMAVGLCALPASFIAGILWDKINISSPFYLSIMLTVGSIIMLMFVKENNISVRS